MRSIVSAANYLRLESPVAYRLRNASSPQSTKYGVNFATGGTGVFDTLSSGPNVSTQIDQFHGLLGQAYSPAELKSSAALVTISGNDYGAYLEKNGSIPVSIRVLDHKSLCTYNLVYKENWTYFQLKKIFLESNQNFGTFLTCFTGRDVEWLVG